MLPLVQDYFVSWQLNSGTNKVTSTTAVLQLFGESLTLVGSLYASHTAYPAEDRSAEQDINRRILFSQSGQLTGSNRESLPSRDF